MAKCSDCGSVMVGASCLACGAGSTKGGRPDWLPVQFLSVQEAVADARNRYMATGPRDVGAGPQDCVKAARRLAHHLTHGSPDKRAWAKRIIERHKLGHAYPMVALENAREALRLIVVKDADADEERAAIQAEAA